MKVKKLKNNSRRAALLFAVIAGTLALSSTARADVVPVIDVGPQNVAAWIGTAGSTADTAANTLDMLLAIGQYGVGQYTYGTVLYYLSNINDVLDAQFGVQQEGAIGGEAITALSDQVMTDTIDANARTNTLALTDEWIAVNNMLPPNGLGGASATYYSKCAVTQSARAKSDLRNLEASAKHMLVRAAGNRPSGPDAVSADLKARMALGLAPCTMKTDPDAQTGKALGCGNAAPSWGDEYEGADLTKSALFDTLQFPVPPNYMKQIRGTYQSLPMVTDAKYMPYVAAYSYCQHLTPRRSAAPMAATADAVMAAENYSDLASKSNEALDQCMDLLEERSQYPSSGAPGSKYVDMYTDQYTQCVDDAYNGIIDTAGKGNASDPSDCKANGRSALQAMHDAAYRTESAGYSAGYLAGADRPTLMGEERAALADEASFDAYVQHEKTLLNQAIASTQSSPAGVNTSPLSTIVK